MTSAQEQFIIKHIRLAGALIIVGLVIEGISLFWNHPLSFVAFIGLGGLAIFLGVIIFLLTLVSSKGGAQD